MTTISLAMIVKNEAETIERVLSCAKSVCDELVVADTGSTDNTVELAQDMGAKVVHFDWIDHFAAARNFSFEHCTGDWILWLDADDILTEADQAKLLDLKQNHLDDNYDGVFMTYQYTFSESGDCIFSLTRERLIRRAANLKWEYPVHECIAVPYGRSLHREDINIQHRPLPSKQVAKTGRNLRILEKAVAQGDCSPRNLFYYANELRDNDRTEEAIAQYLAYLEVSNLDWEKHAAMMSLARAYFKLDMAEQAVSWCLKAIAFDSTRAEAFNQLGIHHYNRKEWEKALPFFHAALSLKRPTNGFVSDSDYTWIPYDYASICYDRLGDYHKAIEFTLKALKNNPEKPRLIKNLHWLADQV